MAAAVSKCTRVAVVGAGIVGVSSAVCIKEAFPGFHVTLIAEEFSPNTASDKAGALVHPTSPGSVRQQKWFKDSYEHFKRISLSEDASESGIVMTFGYGLDSSPGPWFFQDTVLGWRTVPEEERQMMRLPDLKTWMFYGSFVVNCRHYLPWLLRRFTDKGGVVVRRRVSSLQELFSHFDIVVNCTGLGARELVQDTSLQPVWGQGRVIEAPWVKYFVFAHLPRTHSSTADDSDAILDIFPRSDGVFVGGLKVWGRKKGPVEDKYRREIQQRVEQVMPSLSNAPTLQEWTGVRPFRKTVKLSIEESAPGKCIIHNYGHGGYGITWSWGCALDVVHLVKEVQASGLMRSKL